MSSVYFLIYHNNWYVPILYITTEGLYIMDNTWIEGDLVITTHKGHIYNQRIYHDNNPNNLKLRVSNMINNLFIPKEQINSITFQPLPIIMRIKDMPNGN